MRRLAVAAGAATAALLLTTAACGSDNPAPKPLGKGSSSPSASPSASTTPTPPVLPAAAREKTKAGAVAFGRGFLDALNYAASTGRVKAFEAMYSPECTRCAGIASGISRTYAGGGSLTGGQWQFRRARSVHITEDIAYAEMIVDIQPEVFVPSAGQSPTRTTGAANQVKVIQVRWNRGWKVAALDPTP